MAKNFLAFLGFVFLVLLLIGSVTAMGGLYDWLGIITLPNGLRATVVSLPDTVQTLKATDSGIGKVEWSNPLDGLIVSTSTPAPTETPVPTPTFEPTATATPIPPLDPQVYQAETLNRMQSFASALQHWMTLNNAFAADNEKLNDPAWKDEVRVALADIRSTGSDLAAVGPAPAEYAQIDAWFDQLGSEANGLADSYGSAVENGDANDFVTASRHFEQIKADLSQAVVEMQAAGWNLQ